MDKEESHIETASHNLEALLQLAAVSGQEAGKHFVVEASWLKISSKECFHVYLFQSRIRFLLLLTQISTNLWHKTPPIYCFTVLRLEVDA
jgi:hypothetical protein